jgi:hypothetical protein
MRRMPSVRAITLCAALLMSSSAPAATLDQAFGEPGSGRSGGAFFLTTAAYPDYGQPAIDQAQTFTVGLSGSLVGAGLWLGANTGVSLEPLQIELRRTVDGAPSNDPGDLLSTVTLTQAEILPLQGTDPLHRDTGWVTFSFANAPTVSAGDMLALVLQRYPIVSPPGLLDEQAYRVDGERSNRDGPYAVPMYEGGQTFHRDSVSGDAWSSPDDDVETWDWYFATYVVPEPADPSVLALGLVLPLALRRRR